MLPEQFEYNGGQRKEFLVDKNGQFTVLWKVDGWYTRNVHFSKRGRYLVREGNWARGRELSPEDVAVVFYDQGIELKSYSTDQLVKDPSKRIGSISHYIWRKKGYEALQLNYRYVFKKKT